MVEKSGDDVQFGERPMCWQVWLLIEDWVSMKVRAAVEDRAGSASAVEVEDGASTHQRWSDILLHHAHAY
jgi:hypothetical protein